MRCSSRLRIASLTATAALLAAGLAQPTTAGAVPSPTAVAVDRAPGADAEVTTLSTGWSNPWAIAFLPDGRSALVTENETSRVFRLRDDGSRTPAGKVPHTVLFQPGDPAKAGCWGSPRLRCGTARRRTHERSQRARRADPRQGAGHHHLAGPPVLHADPRTSDRIGGRRSFAEKERAAELVRAAGLPLGLNVVLHRENLDAVDAIVELGVSWGVDRIELANVQFYGWGLLNRAALLPTRDQLAAARDAVERWRERLSTGPQLVWVVPDYFDGVAKPCMGGWGAVSLTVTPDGTVLPCPAAASLPDLDSPNVRDHALDWIWHHSKAFDRYRGTDWMAAPCRSGSRRDEDFGGCRCQAFALTGDAARTDPHAGCPRTMG